MTTAEGSFAVSAKAGEVSWLSLVPDDPLALVVLGHGAGAGMRHAGMESVATTLAAARLATFRYQFPYMERGKRFPDPLPLRLTTVGAAVAAAARQHPDLPLFAGGRSMGGRMSSTWAAANPDSDLRGLLFFAFPLHPPRKPGIDRAAHLSDVRIPMLFLQGTRDALASLDLFEPICAELGERARLHVIEGADHSHQVLKRSGRTRAEVFEEMARVSREFVEGVLA